MYNNRLTIECIIIDSQLNVIIIIIIDSLLNNQVF